TGTRVRRPAGTSRGTGRRRPRRRSRSSIRKESMMTFVCRGGVLLSLVAGVALAVAGCGPSDTGKGTTKATEKATDQGGGHGYKGRDWCVEHGMPESICVQCDASLEK